MSFTFPCFFLGINQLSLKSKWSNCNWTSISQSPNNEDVSPEKWQQQDGANSGLSNMSVTLLNNILFKLAHTLHRTGFLKSFEINDMLPHFQFMDKSPVKPKQGLRLFSNIWRPQSIFAGLQCLTSLTSRCRCSCCRPPGWCPGSSGPAPAPSQPRRGAACSTDSTPSRSQCMYHHKLMLHGVIIPSWCYMMLSS